MGTDIKDTESKWTESLNGAGSKDNDRSLYEVSLCNKYKECSAQADLLFRAIRTQCVCLTVPNRAQSPPEPLARLSTLSVGSP